MSQEELLKAIGDLCEGWLEEELRLRRGSSTAWIKACLINKCRHELMIAAGMVEKPKDL